MNMIRQTRRQGMNKVLFSGHALMSHEFLSITVTQDHCTIMNFVSDSHKSASEKESANNLAREARNVKRVLYNLTELFVREHRL